MATKLRGPLRSEVVTVRLDPKLRYLADLAARKQRRTVSSFIEWAVERGLDSVVLSAPDDGPSIWREADNLWDVDESDRFVKVAVRHPELLTHDEQILWKLIRENGWCWKGRYVSDEWTWSVNESSALLERVREHWDNFKAAAAGDAIAKSKLPEAKPRKQAGSKKPAGKFDDMDDEVPF